MTQVEFNKLVKKWDLELTALSEAFDDPFTWNKKCLEILEGVEKRVIIASTARQNKPTDDIKGR